MKDYKNASVQLTGRYNDLMMDEAPAVEAEAK